LKYNIDTTSLLQHIYGVYEYKAQSKIWLILERGRIIQKCCTFLDLFERRDDKNKATSEKSFKINFIIKKINSFVWFCILQFCIQTINTMGRKQKLRHKTEQTYWFSLWKIYLKTFFSTIILFTSPLSTKKKKSQLFYMILAYYNVFCS